MLGWYSPSAHVRQLGAPTSAWYFPTLQFVQPVAPVSENLPAAQASVQAEVRLDAVEYLPASQDAQLEDPVND